jgi:hypothetical protein
MAKLTETQRMVLSSATAREDGAAVAPAKTSKAGVAKIGTSLVARRLMREIRAKPGMPVWGEDDAGRPFSIVVTRAGRGAIGKEKGKRSDPPALRSNEIDKSAAAEPAGRGLRAGTKQALIVALLSNEEGATLDALIDATGWLPHTMRAALTGLRKKGYRIERKGGAGEGPSAYRVVSTTKDAA